MDVLILSNEDGGNSAYIENVLLSAESIAYNQLVPVQIKSKKQQKNDCFSILFYEKPADHYSNYYNI